MSSAGAGGAGAEWGVRNLCRDWGWGGCEADGAACVCVFCVLHLSRAAPLSAAFFLLQCEQSVVAPPSLIFPLPFCLHLCPLAQQSFLRAAQKGVQLH